VHAEGACPTCPGHGIIQTDRALMDPITTTCEVCAGTRFTADALRLTLRGPNTRGVLSMSGAEAPALFTAAKVATTARPIHRVGLGDLQLGQPLNALSGGECQRIKLATELGKKGSVYVMGEPTTGLHMSDVDSLVHLVDDLVEKGNSVIVIEHNLDVVKHADWVVDLGPEIGRAHVWNSSHVKISYAVFC